MGLAIDRTASDFGAETSQGTVEFHDRIGVSWSVSSSHPQDCTDLPEIRPEFETRGVLRQSEGTKAVHPHRAAVELT